MSRKATPPLTPQDSDYLGLDTLGRHTLAWPSRSRPGVRHVTHGDERRATSCTCEAWTYHPERPCLHMTAFPDALAHHLDPPPDDAGGAARMISLANDRGTTIVDEADYELASQYQWHLYRSRGGHLYARTWSKGKRTERKRILLHRLLLDAPDGLQVDHRNGDGLDNRRGNLRLATNAENSRNSRPYSNNRSGCLGVRWDERKQRFIAAVKFDGEQHHIGTFRTLEEADRAVKQARAELFGEFTPEAGVARADGTAEALTAAQGALDEEIGDWNPCAIPTASRRGATALDAAVAEGDDRWIVSRTPAGIRLVCATCGDVRGWRDEAEALAFLRGAGAHACLAAPPAPEPARERKPIEDHLDLLYGA